MIVPYFRISHEMKDVSAVLHGARRRQHCSRCHSTYENRLRGRKITSCVVAEKIDTKRKVVDKQAEVANLGGRDLGTRKREVQKKTALLSTQSLAE